MDIRIETVSFTLQKPFAITGCVFSMTETIRVTLEHNGVTGRGEAVGSYYLNETPESMTATLESVRPHIDETLSTARIQELLSPGGARNALDCAFWDYRAKAKRTSICQLLELSPKPLTTVFTLGIDTPEAMAAQAQDASAFPHLKIKLDADRPIERLEGIRAARPDASLIIDVNQGWSFAELQEYAPHCARLGVAMIEQPLPRGGDAELESYRPPVPLGADESCLHLGEFAAARRRYQTLNIKLDKCGGLTEGLALANAARKADMALMVGNMMGSSLSMAPSFIIGLRCRFVDIDGPLLLANDVAHGLFYDRGGKVAPPLTALWG
jgi:L-alanine-DL-glutamate epimerase-like enolase superfamily enzyme